MNLPEFKNPPPPPLQLLNEAQLLAIEEMGANGFDAEEIATVLDVDRDAFLKEFKTFRSEIQNRYKRGFLKSSLELRQRIFIDAKNGSSPAQTLAKKILDDAEYKMQ